VVTNDYAANACEAFAANLVGDGIKPSSLIGDANLGDRVQRLWLASTDEADADGFLQDVTSGPRHHLSADEPLAYGGTDKGLSPYGLLSAALGACTSMTVRMYARRKGWPLWHVRVDVIHDKVHAQDAAGGAPEKIDVFRREIAF
jgi:organic hydroperoxide reductase OsmC/OhrA